MARPGAHSSSQVGLFGDGSATRKFRTTTWAVAQLVRESEGEEQALYVLAAATGMRISEALALEGKHFINNGRTIEVQQQVDRETPRIVSYLKTDAAYREVDLSTLVAEYLRSF
jgi:integrase